MLTKRMRRLLRRWWCCCCCCCCCCCSYSVNPCRCTGLSMSSPRHLLTAWSQKGRWKAPSPRPCARGGPHRTHRQSLITALLHGQIAPWVSIQNGRMPRIGSIGTGPHAGAAQRKMLWESVRGLVFEKFSCQRAGFSGGPAL